MRAAVRLIRLGLWENNEHGTESSSYNTLWYSEPYTSLVGEIKLAMSSEKIGIDCVECVAVGFEAFYTDRSKRQRKRSSSSSPPPQWDERRDLSLRQYLVEIYAVLKAPTWVFDEWFNEGSIALRSDNQLVIWAPVKSFELYFKIQYHWTSLGTYSLWHRR